MKTILMIVSIITGLLLFSTTICGMWIRRQSLSAEEYAASVGFHANIAYATALFGIVLVILVILNIRRL